MGDTMSLLGIQFNHKGLEQEPQISVITQLWNKLTRSITNQTEQVIFLQSL